MFISLKFAGSLHVQCKPQKFKNLDILKGLQIEWVGNTKCTARLDGPNLLNWFFFSQSAADHLLPMSNGQTCQSIISFTESSLIKTHLLEYQKLSSFVTGLLMMFAKWSKAEPFDLISQAKDNQTFLIYKA